MIHTKRTQLRRQIRKTELEGFFAVRRKELLEGKITIFKDLYRDMSKQQSNMQFDLVGKVINCLHSYPEEQNSYILAGNLLLDQEHFLQYLLPVLTETPYNIESQMWCLRVAASSLAKEGRQEDSNHSRIEEDMESVLQTAYQIFLNVLRTLKWVQSCSQKDRQIWAQYMQILKVVLNSKLYDRFPQHSVAIFGEGLSLKVLSEAENCQELIASWLCLKVILRNFDQLQQLRELLRVSGPLFWLILRHVPYEREQCLELLTTLLQNCSIDFMGSVFCLQLVDELLFLMAQLSTMKPKIAHFLKLLVPQCSLDQLVLLLNQGTHKMLTTTMEWSMNAGCNPCLEDCLTAIYFLLLRLKDAQQQKLINRALEEVESLHFDEMLSGLSEHQQNQTVEHFLDLLIDEFYSPEQAL